MNPHETRSQWPWFSKSDRGHWYGTNVKPGDKLPFSAVLGDTVLGTPVLGTHWVLASHHFTACEARVSRRLKSGAVEPVLDYPSAAQRGPLGPALSEPGHPARLAPPKKFECAALVATAWSVATPGALRAGQSFFGCRVERALRVSIGALLA